MIVEFVDENRDEFGVEFICRQLQVAPSSYYAAKKRQIAPSARAVRDAIMMQVLLTLWITNRKVYGADKLWKAARRAGHDTGRDQVARLMRRLGIEGVSRLRKKLFTTRQDHGPDATGWDSRRRRARTRHLVLGALVQRGPAPRPLR